MVPLYPNPDNQVDTTQYKREGTNIRSPRLHCPKTSESKSNIEFKAKVSYVMESGAHYTHTNHGVGGMKKLSEPKKINRLETAKMYNPHSWLCCLRFAFLFSFRLYKTKKLLLIWYSYDKLQRNIVRCFITKTQRTSLSSNMVHLFVLSHGAIPYTNSKLREKPRPEVQERMSDKKHNR